MYNLAYVTPSEAKVKVSQYKAFLKQATSAPFPQVETYVGHPEEVVCRSECQELIGLGFGFQGWVEMGGRENYSRRLCTSAIHIS